jgi:hypothetical protein
MKRRSLLTLAIAFAAVHGGACGAGDPPANPALSDVIFAGGATAPALEQLLAASPVSDAGRAPVIDSPPSVALLSATTPFTFQWHMPGKAAQRGAPRLLPPDRAPVVPAWLREWVGPERAAHADTQPMNGTGYFLLFSTETAPQLLRVFTTATSFTPDAKAWAKLTSAGSWTTLVVASASFAEDQLVKGSGPFTGASVQFCIEQ